MGAYIAPAGAVSHPAVLYLRALGVQADPADAVMVKAVFGNVAVFVHKAGLILSGDPAADRQVALFVDVAIPCAVMDPTVCHRITAFVNIPASPGVLQPGVEYPVAPFIHPAPAGGILDPGIGLQNAVFIEITVVKPAADQGIAILAQEAKPLGGLLPDIFQKAALAVQVEPALVVTAPALGDLIALRAEEFLLKPGVDQGVAVAADVARAVFGLLPAIEQPVALVIQIGPAAAVVDPTVIDHVSARIQVAPAHGVLGKGLSDHVAVFAHIAPAGRVLDPGIGGHVAVRLGKAPATGIPDPLVLHDLSVSAYIAPAHRVLDPAVGHPVSLLVEVPDAVFLDPAGQQRACHIVRKVQADPALFGLAPNIVGGCIDLCDLQLFALVGLAQLLAVGAGSAANIDLVPYHSHRQILHRAVGGQIHRHTLRIGPAGIQHLVTNQSIVHFFHLFTGGGVPAGEGVGNGFAIGILVGRRGFEHRVDSLRLIGLEAVDTVLGRTAAACQEHPAVAVRECLFRAVVRLVFPVDVHIGFAHTALHQNEFAAGGAPKTDAVQEAIALVALADHLVKVAVGLAGPLSAAVVGKADQRIKLMLLQLQLVLVDKGINLFFVVLQRFLQQRHSRFLGDTALLVLLQLIIRAARAVAHGPLAVVHIRLGAEALDLFQIFDQLVRGNQFRRSPNFRGQTNHCAQQHQHCQKSTQPSFYHSHTPPL